MKQVHGLRLTTRKGVEKALLKSISLTFICGFHQLVGQDRKTDFTREIERFPLSVCRVTVCGCPEHSEVIIWSHGGVLRGFPFIKYLHVVHSEHDAKWSLLP